MLCIVATYTLVEHVIALSGTFRGIPDGAQEPFHTFGLKHVMSSVDGLGSLELIQFGADLQTLRY